METFKALLISENEDKSFAHDVKDLPFDFLPKNELLIKVAYSSLNFKDALSAHGNKGVTKNYPHIPGIDAVGEIVNTAHEQVFKKGDKVLVTGYDMGMNTFGGFAQYISVPQNWAIKLPENLSPKNAMAIGTAGLTAAMCIDKIRKNGLTSGKILVSGATGGVGSMAILILKKLGYQVVALSRKKESESFLKTLGADEIINSLENSSRPLFKAEFDGAIDAVGGETLATILKYIKPNGTVSICGNAQSGELNTSVFPFILRGIALFGIDSATSSLDWKSELWHKLANDWSIVTPENYLKEVNFETLWPEIEKIAAGGQVGRVVLKTT